MGTFLKRFSSEAQYQEHLVSLRWQTGYVCAKCGCRHGYRLSNRRYQCAQCRHQTSVTAGTVLHKTHMPLTQWFLAFYFVSQDNSAWKNGPPPEWAERHRHRRDPAASAARNAGGVPYGK